MIVSAKLELMERSTDLPFVSKWMSNAQCINHTYALQHTWTSIEWNGLQLLTEQSVKHQSKVNQLCLCGQFYQCFYLHLRDHFYFPAIVFLLIWTMQTILLIISLMFADGNWDITVDEWWINVRPIINNHRLASWQGVMIAALAFL